MDVAKSQLSELEVLLNKGKESSKRGDDKTYVSFHDFEFLVQNGATVTVANHLQSSDSLKSRCYYHELEWRGHLYVATTPRPNPNIRVGREYVTSSSLQRQ